MPSALQSACIRLVSRYASSICSADNDVRAIWQRRYAASAKEPIGGAKLYAALVATGYPTSAWVNLVRNVPVPALIVFRNATTGWVITPDVVALPVIVDAIGNGNVAPPWR